MNKTKLESILKQARLPEIPEESLDMFPRRIVTCLKRNDPPVREVRNFSPILTRLAWGFGLAILASVTFAIGQWHGEIRRQAASGENALADIKVIRETLAVFPNRVRAIVQDEHGLNLILSENDDVPASTPIYVRICDGKNCASFVTFSGQEIQAGGRKVTVLADARGGIILTGNRFVWSNTERTNAGDRLKIEARNLGVMAM